MKPEPAQARWSNAWRIMVIAMATLILCSCRSSNPLQKNGPAPVGPAPSAAAPGQAPIAPVGQPAGTGTTPVAPAGIAIPAQYGQMPYGAVRTSYNAPICPPLGNDMPGQMNGPMDGSMRPPMGPPGMEGGVPLGAAPVGPWMPPGVLPPWPDDEYLTDGGNSGPLPAVNKQGQTMGLHLEDTVAHYETVDGRTVVEPSNKVAIYAPRFGSVRQVVDAEESDQRNRATGLIEPVKPFTPRTSDAIVINRQQTQPLRDTGTHPAELIRSRQSHSTMLTDLGPRQFNNSFRLFENITVIRTGVYIESEGAVLSKGVNAAIAWTHNQSAQVILDGTAAMSMDKTQKCQETYTIDSPGNSKLRLIKVASTMFAEPGDEVSFTLRFDNLGTRPLKKVVILDSLSTRLEFVPGSAQCSLKSTFSTQPNEGESLVVRCELSDPLAPGKGGVIRFKCVVR
jgi:uncharacterized repeat protein (TIGR01451 family)